MKLPQVKKPVNILREISVISRKLMVQSPFYGFFMMTLNRIASKKIPTAGVCRQGINFELMVNPIFWQTLSEKEKRGVFQHEMMHLVFNHVTEHKRFSNKQLYNVAADLYINSLIIKEHSTDYLPGANYTPDQHKERVKHKVAALSAMVKAGGKTKQELADVQADIPVRGVFAEDFDFTRDQCIEWGTSKIYKKLVKMDQDGDQRVKGVAVCQGNKPGEGDDLEDNKPWDHQDWKDIQDSVTPEELDMMQKQIEYQLKEVVQNNNLKDRGLIPGYAKELIELLFKKNPPVTDWKAYMRRFFTASTERYSKRTRRKESRRMPGMPGVKIKSKQRVLILIDTSGSVSNDEILECRNEIYHIKKMGFGVDVCEVDTAIGTESIYEFKGTFRPFVTGRGGTDFEPGVEYANSVRKKYSCAIYMTDGECSPPRTKCRLPLMWLLTTKGDSIKRFRDRGHKGPAVKVQKPIETASN